MTSICDDIDETGGYLATTELFSIDDGNEHWLPGQAFTNPVTVASIETSMRARAPCSMWSSPTRR